MAETKYGKYIISGSKPPPLPPDAPPRGDIGTGVVHVDDDVIKGEGAYYLACNLVWKASDLPSPGGTHAHKNWVEYLGFIGSNPDDPYDLGGEVEFWLGGEKHIITKSSVVFVPKGLTHCPIYFRRVDRPFFYFTTGPTPVYNKDEDK
jgi:hypothetical protein